MGRSKSQVVLRRQLFHCFHREVALHVIASAKRYSIGPKTVYLADDADRAFFVTYTGPLQ
jgi:hypothetical protein